MRKEYRRIVAAGLALFAITVWLWPPFAWSALILGPLLIMSVQDYLQKRHSVRRNFPLVGRFRYLLESIRPEINQYFVESNTDGVPFNREQRSLVYQRSKRDLDTLPFGTQKDVYAAGYEWVNHSLKPRHPDAKDLRVVIGGPDCRQPYSASIFNISAMSYGSLSPQAITALSAGAREGGFYHNTGEGSVSPYHLAGGGDLVYQIGTAYFGCRAEDGRFAPEKFQVTAQHPQVKMIEVKLSQGAKPGHGGILPAAKLTPEIAAIRGVPMGRDILSPPAHSAFESPEGLCHFLGELRELSGGKPVGFKLCVGKKVEFIAICKAILKTGIAPDFITVDGGEGGTGAAPVEYSNSVGSPLKDGLIFVHNALTGFGLRGRIRVIASGKVITGFDVLRNLAIGADICNSARGMMLALGCIQALRCNSNKCPVGVATQDPDLASGLDVPDKSKRVASYHAQTLKATAEIMGSMGIARGADLRPWMILRRTSEHQVRHYAEIYSYLSEGVLLDPARVPAEWVDLLHCSSEASFEPCGVTPSPDDFARVRLAS